MKRTIYIVSAGDSYGNQDVEMAFESKEDAERYVEERKSEWTEEEDDGYSKFFNSMGLQVSIGIDEIELASDCGEMRK